MSEVVTLAKQQNVQVIALIVPSKNQVGLALNSVRPRFYPRNPLDANLAAGRMAQILTSHGIYPECQIDLMDMLRQHPLDWKGYYLKTDAHLNEAGNIAVAQFVSERLQHIAAPVRNDN